MTILSFRVDDSGDTRNVSYDDGMLVKDFISAFLKSNNIYNTSDPNIYTFKVGSKVLNIFPFISFISVFLALLSLKT